MEANHEILTRLEIDDMSDVPPTVVPEPHVLRYVVEALADPELEEVALSEEESASTLLVLKTVIDCLHNA